MRWCRCLSYTLASGKGSSYTQLSFHCFKELEKSLNETPMWSTDCGGRAVPHVEMVDRGPKVICAVWMEQKALKHTNTCVGYIAAEARESMGKRHANRGGSRTEVRRACVRVAVDGIDYM